MRTPVQPPRGALGVSHAALAAGMGASAGQLTTSMAPWRGSSKHPAGAGLVQRPFDRSVKPGLGAHAIGRGCHLAGCSAGTATPADAGLSPSSLMDILANCTSHRRKHDVCLQGDPFGCLEHKGIAAPATSDVSICSTRAASAAHRRRTTRRDVGDAHVSGLPCFNTPRRPRCLIAPMLPTPAGLQRPAWDRRSTHA